jgi:hypothetical protein
MAAFRQVDARVVAVVTDCASNMERMGQLLQDGTVPPENGAVQILGSCPCGASCIALAEKDVLTKGDWSSEFQAATAALSDAAHWRPFRNWCQANGIPKAPKLQKCKWGR